MKARTDATFAEFVEALKRARLWPTRSRARRHCEVEATCLPRRRPSLLIAARTARAHSFGGSFAPKSRLHNAPPVEPRPHNRQPTHDCCHYLVTAVASRAQQDPNVTSSLRPTKSTWRLVLLHASCCGRGRGAEEPANAPHDEAWLRRHANREGRQINATHMQPDLDHTSRPRRQPDDCVRDWRACLIPSTHREDCLPLRSDACLAAALRCINFPPPRPETSTDTPMQ